MKLMDKASKAEHAERLADKWECRTEEQRGKWVKYYMGCGEYLDFDGEHVIEIEKPSIRSEFWYDDEYDSPLTDDPEQRKRYFMAENMRWQFKDFGLSEWDECERQLAEIGCCTGRHLSEPFLAVWPSGECYPVFFYDFDYAHIDEARGMSRIPMTAEQIDGLREVIDNQRSKFEKRLETYWKRYGDKVSAHGYWANR